MVHGGFWFWMVMMNSTKIIKTNSDSQNYLQLHSRYSLFWDVTLRKLVVSYWRFGTAYRFHLQGPSSPWRLHDPWTKGTCCPETSVTTNLGCVTPQKSEYLIQTAVKVWNHSVRCLYTDKKIYIVLSVLTINRVTDLHQIMPTCFTLVLVWLISRRLLLDLSGYLHVSPVLWDISTKSGSLQFVYVYISSPEQDWNPRLSCFRRYALLNDVSFNDGPHIRRWSHKIIIL
jgi:hypothetical protein